MFSESSCSSSGIANKSHGLCFCACSPCPRKVFDFRVCLPQAQENMACPCWLGRGDAHPHWVVAAEGCIGQECLRLYIYVIFFITCCCHSYYFKITQTEKHRQNSCLHIFLAVPAALQAAFRVKQCYLGLLQVLCSVCPSCSLQASTAHSSAELNHSREKLTLLPIFPL